MLELSKLVLFLGGTCNGSTWREELIKYLELKEITYYNPVVPDWSSNAQQIERIIKSLPNCYELYVITPEMTGTFSIAEVMEAAIIKKHRCIFMVKVKSEGGHEFDVGQIKSLKAVGKRVACYGGYLAASYEDIVDYVYNRST